MHRTWYNTVLWRMYISIRVNCVRWRATVYFPGPSSITWFKISSLRVHEKKAQDTKQPLIKHHRQYNYAMPLGINNGDHNCTESILSVSKDPVRIYAAVFCWRLKLCLSLFAVLRVTKRHFHHMSEYCSVELFWLGQPVPWMNHQSTKKKKSTLMGITHTKCSTEPNFFSLIRANNNWSLNDNSFIFAGVSATCQFYENFTPRNRAELRHQKKTNRQCFQCVCVLEKRESIDNEMPLPHKKVSIQL